MVPTAVLRDLEVRQARTILAHELAHHRRGDLWVNSLQIFLSILWWFNPLLRLVNYVLRRLREDCCDDMLLCRNLTTDNTYCQALIQIASSLRRTVTLSAALGFARTVHPLGKRITRIMDPQVHRWSSLSRGTVLSLAVLASLLLPGLSSERPAASQISASVEPAPAAGLPGQLADADAFSTPPHTHALVEHRTAGFPMQVDGIQPPGGTLLSPTHSADISGKFNLPRTANFAWTLDRPGSPRTSAFNQPLTAAYVASSYSQSPTGSGTLSDSAATPAALAVAVSTGSQGLPPLSHSADSLPSPRSASFLTGTVPSGPTQLSIAVAKFSDDAGQQQAFSPSSLPIRRSKRRTAAGADTLAQSPAEQSYTNVWLDALTDSLDSDVFSLSALLTDPSALLFDPADTTVITSEYLLDGQDVTIALASADRATDWSSNTVVVSTGADNAHSNSAAAPDSTYHAQAFDDDVPTYVDLASALAAAGITIPLAVPEPLTVWFLTVGGFLLTRRRILATCR